MGEAITKTGVAMLPVWNSKGTETTADNKTYKAKVKYYGRKNEDGRIFIYATEMVKDKAGKDVTIDDSGQANHLERHEKCDSKEAKAYLEALGWQGQCTNGVDILYYTVK